VLADHGEGLGEHGEALHGTLLYDATTHIPLIMRPPAGQAVLPTVGFPVSTADVGPTLLDAAGLGVPEGLDGISLRRWVLPTGAPVPAFRTDRAVYVESLYAWHHYGWAPQRAVVDPLFKLVDGARPELYGRQDADELENLAALRGTVVEGLRAYIDATYADLSPAAGAGAPMQLSAAQASQLEALGYMTGGVQRSDALPPFRGELPAPMANLSVLTQTEGVRAARQRGDLEAAERAAREVLRQAPGFGQVQSQLAGILEDQGRLDDALVVARALDAERPASHTKALLGRLRMRSGDLEGGLGALREAVDLDPYIVGNWMSLLLAVWSTGDRAGFAALVAEARLRLPDEPAIAGLHGVVLALDGDRAEAREVLQAALSRDPGLPIVREALGRLELADGDAVRGEAFLREEIQGNPPAQSALRELVRVLAEQGRHADQLDALASLAAAERPPRPQTAWSQGQALFNLGRFAEAEVAVDRCLRLAAETPGCWLLRANVLDKQGKATEAIEAFEQAQALRAE
jgi:tetratricopeptide (TPR) repeat protein